MRAYIDPAIRHSDINRNLTYQRIYFSGGESPTDEAYISGHFLTNQELETMIRRAVDMARRDGGVKSPDDETFEVSVDEIVKAIVKEGE